MPKIDVLQASIKVTAISGISLFWVNFTIEAFKFARHIFSTSPEKETSEPVVKQRVMCEECQGYFLDDGGELIHGKFLCEYCSDGLLRDELELKK